MNIKCKGMFYIIFSQAQSHLNARYMRLSQNRITLFEFFVEKPNFLHGHFENSICTIFLMQEFKPKTHLNLFNNVKLH